MRDRLLSNKNRLEDVIEAINSINDFIKGQNEKDFLADLIVQSAVLYQFAVIGEAVARIDNDFLEKYPYPWHFVKSFRNFILHEYHAIEMWVVWETIVNDLPELKNMIVRMLENEF